LLINIEGLVPGARGGTAPELIQMAIESNGEDLVSIVRVGQAHRSPRLKFTAVRSAVVLSLVCAVFGLTFDATVASAAKAKGTPIKIMMLATTSSPAFSFPELPAAAAAATAALNASGGIHGHPVQIINCNDQYDPNVAASCARQAVSDHVAAVLAGFTEYATTVTPILAPANIVFFGNFAGPPVDYTSPIAYPLGSPVVSALGVMQHLISDGCKRMGFGTAPSPTGTALYNLAVTLAKTDHATITSDVTIPDQNPDFSTVAAQLAANGAQCAFANLLPTDVVTYLTAMHQVAPSLPLGGPNAGIIPATGVTSIYNGLYVGSSNLLPSSTSNADVRLYVNQLKKYSPGAAMTSNSLRTWGAAEILFNAMKTIKGTVNAKSVLKAVRSITKPSVSVFGPELNLTKSQSSATYLHLFGTYDFVYQLRNEKLVLVGKPINVASSLLGS
jgi:ABC-type branched-subunit amino acid transport system substrate-binding protein